MKKKTLIKILIILLLIVIGIIIFFVLSNFPFYKREQYMYSPEKAIEYSYKYITERDPDFPNFEYNCTAYISQCLIAGGLEMDEVKAVPIPETDVEYNSKKWFCYSFDLDPHRPISYYFSSSFSSYKDFVKYWTRVGDVTSNTVPNTEEGRKILRQNIKLGDVIILYEAKGSAHAALIVKMDEDDIYYNSNTNDRYEYPLSSVKEEMYTKITYLNFVK